MTQLLLDAVSANTTGSAVTIEDPEDKGFVAIQVDLDGATGTVSLQGRIDTTFAWTEFASLTADSIATYDRLPQMRAVLSGYTGPGDVSVGVAPL